MAKNYFEELNRTEKFWMIVYLVFTSLTLSVIDFVATLNMYPMYLAKVYQECNGWDRIKEGFAMLGKCILGLVINVITLSAANWIVMFAPIEFADEVMEGNFWNKLTTDKED